jgi:RNA polymerase sigma factor (sigma-70 family)
MHGAPKARDSFGRSSFPHSSCEVPCLHLWSGLGVPPKETRRTVADSLLQRVARGDKEAVRTCIERYSGLVWSLAQRFCRQRADAEDAVQEIFISVWENAGRFDPSVATETTFVAMIARRRLIDRRRRQLRRREGAPPPSGVLEPVAPSEGSLELSDEARRAAEVLRDLRPEQREVLQMALVYGRTYEEIAVCMRLPLGTVKTHARRGLMRVREVLAGGASATGRSMEVNS